MRENDRSMVEMLGVLAIIGVLSVGAIAGYSKAMMKYKLNKQSEQINQIMMALVEYKSVFASSVLNQSLVPLFKKLNAIPTEMIKANEEDIHDVFGLKVDIIRQTNAGNEELVYLFFSFTGHSNENHVICRNILENFKGYVAELNSLGVNSGTEDAFSQSEWYSKQKIVTMDVQAMQSLCEKCDSDWCNVAASFSLS